MTMVASATDFDMTPRFTWNLIAVALVCVAQAVPHVGVVAPAAKGDSRPFPCQDRPCGCRTYEACWAGDCCCFTLAEKVAWAERRGIVPPVTVAPAERCDAPAAGDCPHCAPKVVLGVAALRCRGHDPAGPSSVAPAVPPTAPVRLVISMPPVGRVAVVTDHPVAGVQRPAVPPPRVTAGR